ncbi:ROK family protein [Alkalibacterium olivapovliticus]|uniref:Putative NBD/HSP70 family sugar kinase n=1 Tax=Alkalibacterium olivapovliticus TaxID=99907 RepID=A0A2T0W5Z8_9LACT|nr:ROK family protein [Alkalibacterium olivapovliticus]PRY82138.1 putative NBD/HSP70 family sugar kinase [Alkalibacterium olivapovliticus]
MAILAFDIGGTTVKYGTWSNETLTDKGNFKTPKTWEEMKGKLVQIKEAVEVKHSLEGIGFSAPGAVNQEARQIEGVSAVRYLHFFPIYDELETLFGLPVSFENDANSAGLAEVWKGAARHNDNVIFVVVGTGIGGAVIVDKKVQQGKHLFGGGFGFMLLNERQTFSEIGTAVSMSRRYAKRMGIPADDIDGKTVFQLANQGDTIAKEEVDAFFFYLTMGLYNLAYAFDPEKIVIGGGISSMDGILDRIDLEFDALFNRLEHSPFRPVIETCEFKNDANLIGAVYNFIQKNKE